jgi:hypothetical protein
LSRVFLEKNNYFLFYLNLLQIRGYNNSKEWSRRRKKQLFKNTMRAERGVNYNDKTRLADYGGSKAKGSYNKSYVNYSNIVK